MICIQILLFDSPNLLLLVKSAKNYLHMATQI